MDAVKHLLSAGGNEEARKKAEKERTNTDADVIQFSGCRDDQTSADARIDGREGAREGGEERTGRCSVCACEVITGFDEASN